MASWWCQMTTVGRSDERLLHCTVSGAAVIIPAPTKAPSLRQYHASSGRWGSSRLKTFRKHPRLAYGLYVAEPRKWPPRAPTSALVTGSAVHDLIAKAGGHESKIYGLKPGPTIELADTLPGGRSAPFYKELVAEYPDKIILTRPDYDKAVAITQAILDPQMRSAEVAKTWLAGTNGYSEYHTAWDEIVPGPDGSELVVPCMQLVDRLTTVFDPAIHEEPYPTHVELKTAGSKDDDLSSADPAEFFWAARRFHYDDQMAFNLRGLTRLLGVEPLGYWAVIETKPPYGVSVVRAGSEILDGIKGRRGRLPARQELDVTLQRLAVALQDTTGSAWALPHERLADGVIPELET